MPTRFPIDLNSGEARYHACPTKQGSFSGESNTQPDQHQERTAEQGKPAYFWALFTNPTARADLLRDSWKGIRRVFFFAVVMDLVYQAIQLRGFRPIETMFVATTLAIVPYVLMRGPINRIISAWQRRDRTRRRAA